MKGRGGGGETCKCDLPLGQLSQSIDNSFAAHIAGSSQPAGEASRKKRIDSDEYISSEDCEHKLCTLIALNTELSNSIDKSESEGGWR